MTATLAFVIILVFLALVFDYINGFHDAANSIATVVSTRVLSPGLAVIWAAFFNFVAFAVFGTRVAKSIGDGVRMDLISADLRLYVLLAALLGAIVWNLITWYLGLPTSSSHALLGGYAGAGIAAYGGVSGLLKTEVWFRTLKFIVLSPLIGMLLGFTLMVLVYWIFRRFSATRVDKIFRRGQLFSAAAFSLGHGGNDAQKTMGIITAVLTAGGVWGMHVWTRRNFAGNSDCSRALRTRRDRSRNAVGWLAHRAHDGNENHETETRRRLLRRDRRRTDTRLRHPHRHTRFDHAHDHRLDRRRRRHAPIVSSEMGRRRPHRLGLDSHHPRRRPRRRRLLLDRLLIHRLFT